MFSFYSQRACMDGECLVIFPMRLSGWGVLPCAQRQGFRVNRATCRVSSIVVGGFRCLFFPDALKWMGGVTSCDQTDGGWSWDRATKRMADGPGNWMAGVLVVPLPAHPFNARIATPTRFPAPRCVTLLNFKRERPSVRWLFANGVSAFTVSQSHRGTNTRTSTYVRDT